MFNEPRNWKWMTPSALTVVFVVAWGETTSWGGWSNVFAGLALICGIAGAMNLWVYAYNHVGNVMADMVRARSDTPEVRIAEAMRQMHPDAVRLLQMQRRSVWRLRYIPAEDFGDWIYDEAPTVHAGFVEFVLDHSNARRGELMPKSHLSDGSKQFDPMGEVTDREQYDALVALMERKLMLTRPMANQPAKFLPPYTIETIRHYFLLDDDGSVEMDAKTATMQRVAEKASRAAVGIPAPKGMVDMGATQRSEPKVVLPKDEPISELSDEEVEAHEIVRREYDALHK
jgi:hypothetical protein